MLVLLDQGTPAPLGRYQQTLSGRQIAIVVIMYAQWPGLEPFVDLVVAAIDGATPGSYREVEVPTG